MIEIHAIKIKPNCRNDRDIEKKKKKVEKKKEMREINHKKYKRHIYPWR